MSSISEIRVNRPEVQHAVNEERFDADIDLLLSYIRLPIAKRKQVLETSTALESHFRFLDAIPLCIKQCLDSIKVKKHKTL